MEYYIALRSIYVLFEASEIYFSEDVSVPKDTVFSINIEDKSAYYHGVLINNQDAGRTFKINKRYFDNAEKAVHVKKLPEYMGSSAEYGLLS